MLIVQEIKGWIRSCLSFCLHSQVYADSSISVPCMYLQVVARYARYVNREDVVYLLVGALLSHHCARRPHRTIQASACFAAQRCVHLLGGVRWGDGGAPADLEGRLQVLRHITNLLALDSPLGFDDRALLFQAAGGVLSTTDMQEEQRGAALTAVLGAVLAPVQQLVEGKALEGEEGLQLLADAIAAVAHLSKGFNAVTMAASPVTRQTLQAATSLLYDGVTQLPESSAAAARAHDVAKRFQFLLHRILDLSVPKSQAQRITGDAEGALRVVRVVGAVLPALLPFASSGDLVECYRLMARLLALRCAPDAGNGQQALDAANSSMLVAVLPRLFRASHSAMVDQDTPQPEADDLELYYYTAVAALVAPVSPGARACRFASVLADEAMRPHLIAVAASLAAGVDASAHQPAVVKGPPRVRVVLKSSKMALTALRGLLVRGLLGGGLPLHNYEAEARTAAVQVLHTEVAPRLLRAGVRAPVFSSHHDDAAGALMRSAAGLLLELWRVMGGGDDYRRWLRAMLQTAMALERPEGCEAPLVEAAWSAMMEDSQPKLAEALYQAVRAARKAQGM